MIQTKSNGRVLTAAWRARRYATIMEPARQRAASKVTSSPVEVSAATGKTTEQAAFEVAAFKGWTEASSANPQASMHLAGASLHVSATESAVGAS